MSRSTYNIALAALAFTALGWNVCMVFVSAFDGLMNWPAFVGSSLAILMVYLLAFEGA